MTTADDAARRAAYTAHLQDEIASAKTEMRQSLEQHEKIIGRKVRELREAHGWSQTDLAERLGELGLEVHQTTVAKMEAGRRPLRVSEAVAVASVFGLPAGALMWLPLHREPPALTELRQEMLDLEENLDGLRKTMLDTLTSFANMYAEQTATLHMRASEFARASATRGNEAEEVTGQVHVFEDDRQGVISDGTTTDAGGNRRQD